SARREVLRVDNRLCSGRDGRLLGEPRFGPADVSGVAGCEGLGGTGHWPRWLWRSAAKSAGEAAEQSRLWACGGEGDADTAGSLADPGGGLEEPQGGCGGICSCP